MSATSAIVKNLRGWSGLVLIVLLPLCYNDFSRDDWKYNTVTIPRLGVPFHLHYYPAGTSRNTDLLFSGSMSVSLLHMPCRSIKRDISTPQETPSSFSPLNCLLPTIPKSTFHFYPYTGQISVIGMTIFCPSDAR